MNHNKKNYDESLLLSELQLLLAEKRTYLSLFRTGIAVFIAPLSVISILIVTINYHTLLDDFTTSLPILGILIGLSVVGFFMFVNSEKKIKKLNGLINEAKRINKHVENMIV